MKQVDRYFEKTTFAFTVRYALKLYSAATYNDSAIIGLNARLAGECSDIGPDPPSTSEQLLLTHVSRTSSTLRSMVRMSLIFCGGWVMAWLRHNC